MAPPEPAVLAAVDGGPMDPVEATPLEALDTLLDPQARLTESGWCRLADGVGYVPCARYSIRFQRNGMRRRSTSGERR